MATIHMFTMPSLPAQAVGGRNHYLSFLRGFCMNLADWRRRIDEIDKKLVKLLNERSQCALEIGKLKQAAKIPLYQPDRENEVLAHAESNNTGPALRFRDRKSTRLNSSHSQISYAVFCL